MMGRLEVVMAVAQPSPSTKPHELNWTIAGILGLLIITALASIPLTLTILHNRESDALVIDRAGRQRMLLERYMKELLLASQGIDARHGQTQIVLQQRLSALIDGGPTPGQLDRSDSVFLPAAPTEQIRAKLLEQRHRLEAFTTKAEAFLRTARGATAYESMRDELLRDNAALLDIANDAVALLTQHSEARIQRLIRWELLVLVLVVSVAALQTWRFLNAERALKQSQAMTMEALRQSDAVKSSLLSSVSHELRTPLTSIKSMVFSLQDNSQGGPPRTEFLRSIDEQVDYLNRLVGNLLDMSRLEAGILRPHREWHVLDELVEGAVRRVAVLLADRPLHCDLSADLPPFYVDGVQIQQVLVNLLDNAVKFSSPQTPIHITASIEGKTLNVSVSNTGAGIPSAELERIFDRFYRVRPGDSTAPPGTGLGLAICKGIIEGHGGQIMAHSRPGGETTVLFRLPLITSIPVQDGMTSHLPAAQRTA